jgi:tRNA-dihydrouridine synthase
MPSRGALLFAPMEGITDHLYRQVIAELYPEWDRLSTDFLRIPSQTIYPIGRMKDHLGHHVLDDYALFNKHIFQVLTCAKGMMIPFLENLNTLGIPHLDLNIGCPSRTVTSHGGGSRLLERPDELQFVIKTIRQNFKGMFTTKIRLGFNHADDFDDIIRLLVNEGVDAITIHGRTRAQLYNGVADWNFFERAVKIADIPIIGNGDVWTLEDIASVFARTDCWAIMCGRSALKTPWQARLWRENGTQLSAPELLEIRQREINRYFESLWTTFSSHMPAPSALKRMKSLVRFIFDDFPQGDQIKSKFLRSHELLPFETLLQLQKIKNETNYLN